MQTAAAARDSSLVPLRSIVLYRILPYRICAPTSLSPSPHCRISPPRLFRAILHHIISISTPTFISLTLTNRNERHALLRHVIHLLHQHTLFHAQQYNALSTYVQ